MRGIIALHAHRMKNEWIHFAPLILRFRLTLLNRLHLDCEVPQNRRLINDTMPFDQIFFVCIQRNDNFRQIVNMALCIPIGKGQNAELYLLDFSTGQILTQIETDGYSFDFSSDGRYIVVGRNPSIIYGIEQ